MCYMMQNYICHMELNRRCYRFDKLKVTVKKLRFLGDMTKYIPPNPQLVNCNNERLFEASMYHG